MIDLRDMVMRLDNPGLEAGVTLVANDESQW